MTDPLHIEQSEHTVQERESKEAWSTFDFMNCHTVTIVAGRFQFRCFESKRKMEGETTERPLKPFVNETGLCIRYTHNIKYTHTRRQLQSFNPFSQQMTLSFSILLFPSRLIVFFCSVSLCLLGSSSVHGVFYLLFSLSRSVSHTKWPLYSVHLCVLVCLYCGRNV